MQEFRPRMSPWVVTVAIFVSFIYRARIYVDADCSISLKNDLPNKEPLYLTYKDNHLEFLYPLESDEGSKKEKSKIELTDREQLILACPGGRLMASSEDLSKAYCIKGSKLSVGAKKFADTKDLECSVIVRATLQSNLIRRCSKSGSELTIGFEVEDEFLPLIRVCHDVEAASSVFAEHTVPATVASAKVLSARPDFETGPNVLYQGVKPKKIYTQRHQKTLLNDLLGEGKGDELIQGTTYLARGHLAPDGDFIFGTWQWATYFYVNTAPQWQSINAGHWLALERYVRELADKTHLDLTVKTGTFGILSLESKAGDLVPLYLDPEQKKIPVPLFFWKLIEDKSQNAGIVAICSNNPFKSVKPICNDIGLENHWPTGWSAIIKGRITFCNAEDFVLKTTLDIKPPIRRYDAVLQGLEK